MIVFYGVVSGILFFVLKASRRVFLYKPEVSFLSSWDSMKVCPPDQLWSSVPQDLQQVEVLEAKSIN